MSEISRLAHRLSASNAVVRKAEEFERKAKAIRVAGPGVAAVCLLVCGHYSCTICIHTYTYTYKYTYTYTYTYHIPHNDRSWLASIRCFFCPGFVICLHATVRAAALYTAREQSTYWPLWMKYILDRGEPMWMRCIADSHEPMWMRYIRNSSAHNTSCWYQCRQKYRDDILRLWYCLSASESNCQFCHS